MTVESTPKVLAFAGSLRQDSWNKKLLKLAAEAASTAGAEVEHITLNDYLLPLFSEDLEDEGLPDKLAELRALFDRADGLLIATPEYNGSLPAVLKNTIDWLSRPPKHGEDYQPSYDRKTVAIMSTSPGRLGGTRAIKHLREILTNLGCNVCPDQVSVASASRSFDVEGKLLDQEVSSGVVAVAQQLVAQLQRGDTAGL